MEWEPAEASSSSVASGSGTKGANSQWGGQGNARRGGQFIFQPPQGIDVAPPLPETAVPTGLSSPKDLGPDSFGLPPVDPATPTTLDEHDGGHERERGALMPISTNGLRHEQKRRRERSLRRRKEAPAQTATVEPDDEGSSDLGSDDVRP